MAYNSYARLIMINTRIHTLEKGYIEGVNFSRIVGALGIVIFHFSCYCEPLKRYLYETANCPFGQLWVALFFAVSGACVVRANTELTLWPFYKKRWLSIFPVFFVAYLVVFALKIVIYGNWWGTINPWTFPLTLLGIDSYFYYLQPNYSCIGEWFIGAILACYLLFPILRKMLQYAPYTSAILLLIGCWFIPYLPIFIVEPWHNIWVCATIFYLGMLLSQYPALFTSKISLTIFGVLALLITFIPLPFKQFAPLSQLIYPTFSGIVWFIVLTQIGKYIESAAQWCSRCMRYLGKLAYPIFLVQHAVISAVLAKWSTPTFATSISVLCLDIALTLLLSDVILNLDEKIKKLVSDSSNF